MTIELAVDITIEECIQEDRLKEFLINNRAEARAVSIYEYNQEEHMRMEREQNYADGLADGHTKGAREIVRLCREFGQTEESILQRLMSALNITEKEALEYMKEE